jgi:hypothetical protein
MFFLASDYNAQNKLPVSSNNDMAHLDMNNDSLADSNGFKLFALYSSGFSRFYNSEISKLSNFHYRMNYGYSLRIGAMFRKKKSRVSVRIIRIKL